MYLSGANPLSLHGLYLEARRRAAAKKAAAAPVVPVPTFRGKPLPRPVLMAPAQPDSVAVAPSLPVPVSAAAPIQVFTSGGGGGQAPVLIDALPASEGSSGLSPLLLGGAALLLYLLARK